MIWFVFCEISSKITCKNWFSRRLRIQKANIPEFLKFLGRNYLVNQLRSEKKKFFTIFWNFLKEYPFKKGFTLSLILLKITKYQQSVKTLPLFYLYYKVIPRTISSEVKENAITLWEKNTLPEIVVVFCVWQ